MEKAFLQIRLAKKDRNLVRFVWVDDPFAPEPQIVHYRWKSVVFGVTTSPFLLTATIRHHTMKYSESHPDTEGSLLNDMYMDDFILGAQDEGTARKLAEEATSILQDAGLPLRRWMTNDVSLQAKLAPQEEISTTIGFSDDQSKVLGLVWQHSNDCFYYDPQSFFDHCASFQGCCTKRTVLSSSARIFDPLGLISPIILVPKILLQEIWSIGVDWDTNLPEKLKTQWDDWSAGLSHLSKVKIPRYYYLDQAEARQMELHLFSDACEKAYGTVAFIRSVDSDGKCKISLVASKTRVAPLRKITLPRLELLGCLLSVRLANSIKEALLIDIPTFFWSDSQVALSWILKKPTELKQFVANPVAEIQRSTTAQVWN